MKKLVLASQSRYRQAQLRGLGIPFDVQPAHLDESPLPSETPLQLAQRLALRKAMQIAQSVDHNTWIIGSDQTGDLHGQVLNKPGNHANATSQLRLMSGQIVLFHSAVALVHGERIWQGVTTTRICVRTLSDEAIEHYLCMDQPYDCAGSFKIEAGGSLLMESVSSDDPSALVGLPLLLLLRLLQQSAYLP